MPEPLSPKSGLGMNVAVLPLRRATLRMMYLASITWSALSTSGSGIRSISHWPPVATSWKWAAVRDAAFGHALGHLGAEVDQAVGRRAGEVAQARARLVTEVGRLDPAAVPGPFDRIDVVEGLVPPLVEPDVVEDEELELGGQQAFIGQRRCSACS